MARNENTFVFQFSTEDIYIEHDDNLLCVDYNEGMSFESKICLTACNANYSFILMEYVYI